MACISPMNMKWVVEVRRAAHRHAVLPGPAVTFLTTRDGAEWRHEGEEQLPWRTGGQDNRARAAAVDCLISCRSSQDVAAKTYGIEYYLQNPRRITTRTPPLPSLNYSRRSRGPPSARCLPTPPRPFVLSDVTFVPGCAVHHDADGIMM